MGMWQWQRVVRIPYHPFTLQGGVRCQAAGAPRRPCMPASSASGVSRPGLGSARCDGFRGPVPVPQLPGGAAAGPHGGRFRLRRPAPRRSSGGRCSAGGRGRQSSRCGSCPLLCMRSEQLTLSTPLHRRQLRRTLPSAHPSTEYALTGHTPTPLTFLWVDAAKRQRAGQSSSMSRRCAAHSPLRFAGDDVPH